MEKEEDQIPLQEIVYKPTTQSNTPTALKPELNSKSTSSFLYFSAIIANLIIFTAGIAFAWSSPVLPKLAGHNTTEVNPVGRPITKTEEAWIAGIICLGAGLGPIIAGPTADKIGRKKTLLLAACPMALSFVAIAYANSVIMYYIARLIMGIGVGGAFTVLPMYLHEISEDHNRGTIGTTLGVFISSGLLFSIAVGPFLTIRNFCLLCAAPLIIFIPVFAIWIPETPPFLASINKNRELQISLSKLRNKSSAEIEKEIADISKVIFEQAQNKGGIKDLFKNKGSRKGLMITLGLVLLQQFAGINPVLAYMHNIFNETESGLSSEVSSTIIGIMQVLATVATSLLVDRLGRRILLLTSAMGSCISLVGLGLFFYLKNNEYKVDMISWLPIASLMTFIVLFNIGLGPLPWAVMAELFPSNVKSVASTLNTTTCFTASFVITLFFPGLALLLGMAKSFWLFALVCFGGAIFIYSVLPETKGRSIHEIQALLEERKTNL